MIISASRRTDIPAFYSDWFMRRIREGFFYRVNPFNHRQVSGFSLNPDHVDVICFWTKNPQPLLPHLKELEERGLNFYFQFTLNPYEQIFEPQLPPIEERFATFKSLADLIGPKKVVWRYDPVILTSVTPASWHVEQLELLARQLAPFSRRLTFSFYDFYGKGQGRLHSVLSGAGISLSDMRDPAQINELETLVCGFKQVSESYNLKLFTCSEKMNLSKVGIEHGACVDGHLIRDLFGNNIPTQKDKNQRPDCGCAASVDMGIYNTCPYRCSYCYANSNENILAANLGKHPPNGPALLNGYVDKNVEIRTTLGKGKGREENKQQSFLW